MTFVRSPRCLAQAMCHCVQNLWSIIDCKHFMFFILLISESNPFFRFYWNLVIYMWFFPWVPMVSKKTSFFGSRYPSTSAPATIFSQVHGPEIPKDAGGSCSDDFCVPREFDVDEDLLDFNNIFNYILMTLAWHGRWGRILKVPTWIEASHCDVGSRPWAK